MKIELIKKRKEMNRKDRKKGMMAKNKDQKEMNQNRK